MAIVEFEDQTEQDFHIRSPKLFGASETPTMIKFLLKTKLVKNEKQALGVLIISIVIFIIIALGIYWFTKNRIENKIVDQNGNILTIQQYLINLQKGTQKSTTP